LAATYSGGFGKPEDFLLVPGGRLLLHTSRMNDATADMAVPGKVGKAGWKLFECDTAASTNDLARSLPAWSAVRADTQTGGRGRFGRTFVSDRGGLWISAVLPAGGGLAKWAGFSLMVGVHLVRMLEDLRIPSARLRWPNDLMSGRKKLGGLLIEQSAKDVLIVGFGLNISNEPWTSDPALEAISTSIARVEGISEKCKNRGGGRLVRLETGPRIKNQCPHGRDAHAPWSDIVDPALFRDAPARVSGSVPSIHEMAVRTLDALAEAHQAMEEGGMKAAIDELNLRWSRPVPVKISLAGGKTVSGRFAGLDPLGNLRLLDERECEFLVGHQSIEKLTELG
jgi:biotin-(acetyl-CoA carboxylase) ligase